MLPRLLLLVGLSLPTLTVTAQAGDRAAGEKLPHLRPLTIWLDNPRGTITPNPNLPFSQFEVIDQRPDSARIGVQGNLPIRSHAFDRQLVFRQAADREIAGYLNRHFARPGAPDTAVIILRNLWLSDTAPFTDDADDNSAGDLARTRTHISLRVEVYARRNNRYLPLLRLDTLRQTKLVIYSILRSTYLGWDKELAVLLRELVQNTALAANRKSESGRWIGWEDIRRFNQTRFDVPILDSTALVRGVYAGFEEFRNNAPSIHDFELLPENGKLALYLKNSDGSSYYTRNAWGLSDGKQTFVMRDGLLHVLYKDGNSFYFYGIDIPAADLMTLPLSVFNGSTEQHCLYVVDMDTGQFY